MGKRTHGPQLLIAIEANNHGKVHEILAVQIRNKPKIREICTSDIRRFPTENVDCPLLVAATIPDPNIIRYMVVKHQVNINHVHKRGTGKNEQIITPLMLAVRKKMYFTVETLLSLNADTNFQNHKGKSALHYAVQKADCRMTKMLLSRGAQANIVDKHQTSPVHIATRYGHVGLVKLLLQFGGDLYKKGQYGLIPTHIAAREGHIPLLRLFAQKDFNTNTRVPCLQDAREKAPLHVAAAEGQVETVMVLIDQFSADVNIRDSEGETPLHCTVLDEYDPYSMRSKDDLTETAKVLIKAGGEVNLRNGRGETPLHHASRNEFQKIVELLIRAGADPCAEDNDHNKPIDLVSDDDTVSRNCLKNAMINRERYMGGMLDMRAKGISSSTQSFQRMRSNSNSSLFLENTPRMSRSYSFQGISPVIYNDNAQVGATVYDDGLYLQPVGSKTTLTRSESGTTIDGSVTLHRQDSQESLQSNSSSLYAHILDSSYERRKAKDNKEQGQRVSRKKKPSNFRRSFVLPEDSDSSICNENWERRSLPPGRRSASVDSAERTRFASLRKPFNKKGKGKQAQELVFVRSPKVTGQPPDLETVSLNSEIPNGPIASSSPSKNDCGNIPSSPMIPRDTKVQRSTSLLDESEILVARTKLKSVDKTQVNSNVSVSATPTKESDSSSLWQVTPDASISTVASNSGLLEKQQLNQTPVHDQIPNASPDLGNLSNESSDAIYENIPADDDDHIYGNVPSPISVGVVPPPVVPKPRKGTTPKPVLSPKPVQRTKPEVSRSPEIVINTGHNQVISIQSNPSSPSNICAKIESGRVPESVVPKLQGPESDSDDTFFDDASFDTISESSLGSKIKSPPIQKEHRESIADQLRKVVSDPKLKEWLAEQAERAKVRQESVGHRQDVHIDFGKDPDSDTIKKNSSKLTKKGSYRGPKPAPNPKPRNLSFRGKDKKIVVKPTEPPPLPPDQDSDDDTFDDDSFDTLEDSSELIEDVQCGSNPHNDSVQYESMNNLNNPGKPVPVPRKTSNPSRSRTNTEESKGSQELLNWERVDPRDNDSYYWEHTGTEEFLEAKNKSSPPELKTPPVHRLLPEAEYLQMHGLAKPTNIQDHSNLSATRAPSLTTKSRVSTFKSPPTSPTSPKTVSFDQTDKNQNLIAGKPLPQGSIFVAIPGQGNLTDALHKPVEKSVSDEYQFHKQQLDINASSPKNIQGKIERRLSHEGSPRSPKNFDIPIINLDHSPNSKQHGTSQDHQPDKRSERLSQSSDSSVSHIPGPKNADMYAVVNKSVKRTSSDLSELSSVSTSHRAKTKDTSPRVNEDLDRTPSFSVGPIETSSEVGELRPETGQHTNPVQQQEKLSGEGVYEELPLDDSPKRRVTIGTEEIIFPDDPERKAKDHDHRVVEYNSKGKTRISVVGGNADGIYVHRIDPGSDAEQRGLMEGDQILKINNQSINTMTKEEVTLMLMSLPQMVALTVRYKRDRYEHIAANAGMGDSFYVRANFNYEPTQPGEVKIYDGDVFSVRDTLPDGQMGSWRALKVNARPNEVQHGLIPNEGRAEQVALAQKRVQDRGRSLEREPKASFLRRSFRRSKSAERLNKETDAFNKDSNRFNSVTKPAYEKVEQKPPGFLRPVAIVGLFCDTVRDRLAQDCPGLFEISPPEVEIPTSREEGDGKSPINLKIIHAIIDKRKHCLMIISPRAIQYLQQTELHPIVIYLHPGSKTVIKALRSQLAPRFEKRSSFMYEEAVHFEKSYSHLFTATVTYTNDDSWFTLLKDTISRIQNQPLWQLAPKVVPSSADPSPQVIHRDANAVVNAKAPRLKPLPRGRSITRQIPSAIQNVMHKHAGGYGSNPTGIDLDSSMASIDSVDSMAKQRQPMTLTYDGYFLSGSGPEDMRSSSSSQSLSGTANGYSRATETSGSSDNQDRLKSILKKRPSGGSIQSVGGASDYESDVSFSNDYVASEKSSGLVNGYAARSNITFAQPRPKGVPPSPMMPHQQRIMGNGMVRNMVPSSPAAQRQQPQQRQIQKWGKPPQQQVRPGHTIQTSARAQCKETIL